MSEYRFCICSVYIVKKKAKKKMCISSPKEANDLKYGTSHDGNVPIIARENEKKRKAKKFKKDNNIIAAQ